jgi:23S rRNA (adenine2503-C2)-methyltransferase
MGDPWLDIDTVKKAIETINNKYPFAHHYISTIGIKDSDFSWVKDNITLQISLHSLDENRRNELIPYKRKMSIAELGRTI